MRCSKGERNENIYNSTRNILCRNGRGTRHGLCRHERGGGHKPDAHNFPRYGSVYGGRHRARLRCARERRLGVYIRQEKEPRYKKRTHYDGDRPRVHSRRQLSREPAPVGNDGQLLSHNDIPARNKIHRPPGHDDERGDGKSPGEKACDTVRYLRNDNRSHLRIRRCGRRHDDAAYSHHSARL